MNSDMRIIYLFEEFSLKLPESYSDFQSLGKGWRAQWPKRYNKKEDINLNVSNNSS